MTADQPAPGDARRSRIVDDDTRLLFADLHNHSLFSDGAGDPEKAFVQMRAAGLDVAALTDHASIPHHQIDYLDLTHYPDEDALAIARTAPRSIDDAEWRRTAEIADRFDVPGEFTAIRGFEWTEPWLGHINVWFSSRYLTVDTPGQMSGLHDFLRDHEPAALFGYNHPGREPGRLDEFERHGDVHDLSPRMVALEAFNRTHDYLFVGHADGLPSPLVTCLDAGWRPGLIGCSDEHGRSYGLAGRGRTGVWAAEHSRAGVRAALEARRTYATREVGLLLDASLDGVRMGGQLPTRPGAAELAVDLRGSAYEGRPVELQLLTSDGSGEPVVVALVPTTCGEVTTVDLDVHGLLGEWLVLRVGDPQRPSDTPGSPDHPSSCWGLAYGSPWYLPGTAPWRS